MAYQNDRGYLDFDGSIDQHSLPAQHEQSPESRLNQVEPSFESNPEPSQDGPMRARNKAVPSRAEPS